MKFIVYGKDDCSFCIRAKNLLDYYKYEYTYLTMSKDYTREELLSLAPEAKSVPQIWCVDALNATEHVGGFEDLERYIKRMQIDRQFSTFGEVKIVFTKADGTERTMLCTLKPEYLPEDQRESLVGKTERKKNPDVLAVYDLEKNGWRSFRYDSVLSCQAV